MAPTPPSSSATPPDPHTPGPGSPRRRFGRRGLAACVLAGALLAGGAFGAGRLWTFALSRPGPLPEAAAIVVPHGSTTHVAAALRQAGVVANPWLLRAAAWLTQADGPLHAAELAFPAHASIDQVLAVLRTAKPVQHRLTIPEGLTAQQITGLIAHAEALSGPVGRMQEGAALPQTYDYERGTPRSAVVERARAAMDRLLQTAWANRVAGLPLHSAHDALTLASIVERETARPGERAHVAAVYLNRLRQGMRLEADPTVIYAASNGAGVLDRPLSKADLHRDDPYNTYRVTGLPPGPICAPGQDAIEAVLHPADSDDLYFVADGTGGHVFSRDFAQHDAAVARWRALNAAQTGKAD